MSHSFLGRLYGPGLPGTGTSAEARWRDGALIVTVAREELVGRRLEIQAAGFDQRHVRLSWTSQEGRYTFFVEAPEAGETLVRLAPAEYHAELLRARRQQRGARLRIRLAIGAIAALLIVFVVAVVAALTLADPLSARVAEAIPPEQEARLGELVLERTRAKMPMVSDGPAVVAIRGIGERLVPRSRYRYRWFMAEDTTLNAFAAPGGVVVVTSGLMRAADSPEELAGVLAHEVAHAELRHGLRAMVKSMGLRLALSIALGGGTDERLGSLAASFTELKFSRDAEREADRDAVRRLRAARIDVGGMVTMFDKLQRSSARAGRRPPEFLSTHPDLAERLTSLRRLAASERVPSRPLAVDWQAAKAAADAKVIPEPRI